jgi:hypothetical protein
MALCSINWAESVHAGSLQGVLGQPFAAGRRQALEELGLAAALQQVHTTRRLTVHNAAWPALHP